MKKIYLGLIMAMLSLTVLLTQSCVKKDFDAPPDNSSYDPGLTVTHTIKEIQDLPSPSAITEDWIISGIVNMDDREGNYYKKITIQDETGGIEILLDQNNLYNDYPVGRKVYIKLKGLYKSDYNSLPQLGYTPDATGSLVNVPFTLIDQHLVKANYPNVITPIEVTLESLTSPSASAAYVNKLVVIKDVEFSPELIGLTIADPATVRSATNRNLQECGSSTKVVLRTSGYAKFQANEIPGGRGTLTALYTKFGSTPQLVIRSMDDIQFTEDRCDGSSPTGPETITIASLRDMYTGSAVALSGVKITGTVISDRAGGNAQSRNIVIQQGDKGVMVRFSSNHSFNVGDSLEIMVAGASLEEYNGLLQVNNATITSAIKVGSGTISPKVITIADLNANFEANESILVKIMNATIAGGGTYNGNKTLTDGTGNITLYTMSAATFSGETVPSEAKNFTGIVGQFGTTKQLQIRNLSDVE